MRSLRLRIVLTLSLLAAGCSSAGRDVPGIDNFAEVTPGAVYRGAQPTRDGVATLKRQGVRTVINLRHDPERWEEDAMVAAGINYVWIPMFASNVKPMQVASVLRTLRSAQGPVFIHCRFGRDRTGLAVGAFRIVEQDWPADRAIRELHAYGYHWAIYPGIEKYLIQLASPRRDGKVNASTTRPTSRSHDQESGSMRSQASAIGSMP